MTALLARLQGDLVIARKAQDKPATLLLGTILADIKNRRIEFMRDPTDDDVVEVLRRRESSGVASRSRHSIAEPETIWPTRKRRKWRRSRSICPPPSTGNDTQAAVSAAIAGRRHNIGAVMGKVLPQFKGQTDGGTVSAIVREELSARE